MSINNLYGPKKQNTVSQQQLEDFLRSCDKYSGTPEGVGIVEKADGQVNQSEALVASQNLDGISVELFFKDRNAYITDIAAKMMSYDKDSNGLSFDELKLGAEELRAEESRKLKESRGTGYGISKDKGAGDDY